MISSFSNPLPQIPFEDSSSLCTITNGASLSGLSMTPLSTSYVVGNPWINLSITHINPFLFPPFGVVGSIVIVTLNLFGQNTGLDVWYLNPPSLTSTSQVALNPVQSILIASTPSYTRTQLSVPLTPLQKGWSCAGRKLKDIVAKTSQNMEVHINTLEPNHKTSFLFFYFYGHTSH